MKILLAGDSTMANQPTVTPYDPTKCHCGWGQMISLFFDNVEVHNFAMNGRTVETFRTEGIYDQLKSVLEKGDYVFIQFGHNDQKRLHLRADGGYREHLVNYVNEVREMGGVPILVTSVCRNSWRGDNGEYNDLLIDYVNEVKKIASELDVAMLDLHEVSLKWIKSLGLDGAKKYFYPSDFTHPNDFGGFKWAKFVALLLSENNHNSLNSIKSKLLSKDKWLVEPIREEVSNVKLENVNLICGWTHRPFHKSNLEKFENITELTIADTLEMAKTVFGFFASKEISEVREVDLIACAKENGYYFENLNNIKDLNVRARAELFVRIINLACKCRSNIECANIEIDITKDSISGKEAIDYILKLENLKLGAEGFSTQNNTPKGS